MTNLLTIKEAVDLRLLALELRDSELREKERQEALRLEALKVNFACALSLRIAADYMVVIDAATILAGLRPDFHENFRVVLALAVEPGDDGEAPWPRVETRYSYKLDDLKRDGRLLWWGHGENGAYVESYDLVEALTVALTGKQ